MDAHGSTVWRVCVLYFRASADAQDAFQDTMVKYALADTVSFNDDEHRKAWLIRVAANTCKDMLKASSRANVPLDEGACGDKLVSCDEATQPASFSSEVVDARRARPSTFLSMKATPLRKLRRWSTRPSTPCTRGLRVARCF